jgi:hypothetical protein
MAFKLLATAAVAATLVAADTFKIVAHNVRVIGTPSTEGYVAYAYSADPTTCTGIWALAPPDAGLAADWSSANGNLTTTLNDNTAGVTVFIGGTATVPAFKTEQVICNQGSGEFDASGGAVTFDDGTWMACKLSYFDENAPEGHAAILYRQAGQRTLADCSDIELSTQ